MAPVDVLKESPVGSEGDIDHEVTVPPLDDGVSVVMAEPLVSVSELGLYAITGAASLTRMVTVVVALPPVLLAVTV
tara:strand:- start:49 stop:276 length:228 start_codon:yes stop_codon:yes gene_type:complete